MSREYWIGLAVLLAGAVLMLAWFWWEHGPSACQLPFHVSPHDINPRR